MFGRNQILCKNWWGSNDKLSIFGIMPCHTHFIPLLWFLSLNHLLTIGTIKSLFMQNMLFISDYEQSIVAVCGDKISIFLMEVKGDSKKVNVSFEGSVFYIWISVTLFSLIKHVLHLRTRTNQTANASVMKALVMLTGVRLEGRGFSVWASGCWLWYKVFIHCNYSMRNPADLWHVWSLSHGMEPHSNYLLSFLFFHVSDRGRDQRPGCN